MAHDDDQGRLDGTAGRGSTGLGGSGRRILQAYVAAAARYPAQTWAGLPPGVRITALYREIGRMGDGDTPGYRCWHDLAAAEHTQEA